VQKEVAMRAKHFLAPSAFVVLITIGIAMIGMTSSVFVTSACACGTVNDQVISDLNELDVMVQKYAIEHNGLLPTYDELVVLTAENKRIQQRLTPQVIIVTGAFTFSPTIEDVNKIGYAISTDRREYILLGVGLNEKYKDTYLFGRRIGRDIIGYELPILRPGDIPPKPSPPA
jgi:hypothetical protein